MENIIIIDGATRRPTINNMLKLLKPANGLLIEEYAARLESASYALSYVTSLTREALKYTVKLQNKGIDSVLESCNRDVAEYCISIESESYVVKEQRIGYLRIFLSFLSAEYKLSQSHEMTANIFMFDRVVFIDELSEQDRQTFMAAACTDSISSIARDTYWEHACELYVVLEDLGYSTTTKKALSRAWRCLYVFLCANDLDYAPALAELWIEAVVTKQGDWRVCRRAFAMIDRYEKDGCLKPETVCCREGKDTSCLPTWCGDSLAEYLSVKKRDGQAQSSLKMQLSSNMRFCEYLVYRRLESWDELSPQIVMDFHIQDSHTTAAGKNAYGSRIRQFLGFLAECGYIPETLELALPSSKIKEVSIVEILTDEDLEAIVTYKECAEDPIALRSIAIVLLGLRLGLRGTDIVKLKLTDICWRKQEVSVMQSKTGVALTLPLPTEVTNCLYRYIIEGRPKTTSRSIFIRHSAPFCQLNRTACSAALLRALGRDKVGSVGFHVTRKTFASRMLSSGVPVDTIVDALGHTTNTTVHKYLATDEAGMRSCAIPIAKISTNNEVMSV